MNHNFVGCDDGITIVLKFFSYLLEMHIKMFIDNRACLKLF